MCSKSGILSQRSTMTSTYWTIFFYMVISTVSAVELKIDEDYYSSEPTELRTFGARIHGDQILLKDVLESKWLNEFDYSAVIFNYDIPEPITCITILSHQNLSIDVNFSKVSSIVNGTLANSGEKKTFNAEISIYGFNETTFDNYDDFDGELLNRDRFSRSSLYHDEEINYTNANNFDDHVDYEDQLTDSQDVHESENAEEEEEESLSESNFNDSTDKVIEIGKRQENDQLLYSAIDPSEANPEREEQSVVFYYTDSNVITQIQFIIYGHFLENSIFSPNYIPPTVEFSHFSPTTFKANITDHATKQLLVQMYVYGYASGNIDNIENISYETSLAPYCQPLAEQSQRLKQSENIIVLCPAEKLKSSANTRSFSVLLSLLILCVLRN